jgi:hypothetical protein
MGMLSPNEQRVVNSNGKHTACDEQHELTTHTEVFDVQVYLIVLHGCKSEHSIPGAQ